MTPDQIFQQAARRTLGKSRDLIPQPTLVNLRPLALQECWEGKAFVISSTAGHARAEPTNDPQENRRPEERADGAGCFANMYGLMGTIPTLYL